MSNTTSIVDVIQHYQKSIDISQDNEPRLLHCINKLYKLPIKVEHLQKTGVGKTVNSLRKFNGEIGVAAKTLVTKWKAMVAAEEESIEPMPSNKEGEITEGNDGSNGPNGKSQMHDENYNRHGKHESRERYKQNKLEKDRKTNSNDSKGFSPQEAAACVTSTSSFQQESREREKHSRSNDLSKHGDTEKVKHRHRESGDNTSHQSSSKRNTNSSSSSHKEDKEDKGRHRENSDKNKSKHHSGNRNHSHRSTNEKEDVLKKDKNVNNHLSDINKLENNKRHHKSDHETNDNEFKSPPAKKAKVSSSEAKLNTSRRYDKEDDDDKEDDGFDSSMGANFADVLGMLNVPKKKSKKISKSSPTVTSSLDAINKDNKETPKPSTNHQAVNGNSLLGGGNANVVVRSSMNSRTSSSAISLSSSSKPLTAKPEMLAPTAKLEPLDPNIALELPTISTNYKPMPLNPTVMDCVFNTNTSNSTRPARTLSDAEALNHGISSKTIRTKVYSGVRTGQIYQVSPLFDLCIRFLQKNIDALEYTGGVPYDVLQPVLKKATPQQLFTFEDYNPYLMEDTDTLWQIHVSRNYRTQKRLENETWREMFLRCQEEEERKLNYLADSIKQSQKIAAAPVRKTQLAFLDTMVKPPRNIQRKQEQYGTKTKLVATPATRVAALSAIAPNAAKLGDVRLKVIAANRDNAQISSTASSAITTNISRSKKAPLMQKTLQFIRGRLKR